MECEINKLAKLLNDFAQQYLSEYQDKLNHLPLVEKDEQWPSPCEVGEHNDQFNYWQPTKVLNDLSFTNVEQALAITIHPSIANYYTAIYSETLYATCGEGNLQLLFAWSEQDFERLQQNLIGHVLMKQKLKQPLTLFFGLTDEEDILLSVNNDNGEVWAERVGCIPHKKIADSLTDFICQLKPDIYLEQENR